MEKSQILTNANCQTDNKIRFEPLVNVPPKNVIYTEDCRNTMKRLKDKIVNLIIADPPYYKIKGEFDWAWKTFDDYLKFMEELAIEFKRILADNGTLFIYGHAKRIAYVQVIFDKYFHLGNNIVWRKTTCQTKRTDFDQARYFAPVTERLLMYDNQEEDLLCANIRNYLINEKMKTGLTLTDLNELLTGKRQSDLIAKRYFGTSQWELPTKSKYEILQTTGYFQKEYEELRKEYEELRKEYEELRRPFNNFKKLEDVMEFDQEAQISGRFDHDTIKPLKLSKAIIGTCSKEQDLIYIPFVGSGTECVAARELNRNFIGSELETKYVEIAEARIDASRTNGDLFYDTVAL